MSSILLVERSVKITGWKWKKREILFLSLYFFFSLFFFYILYFYYFLVLSAKVCEKRDLWKSTLWDCIMDIQMKHISIQYVYFYCCLLQSSILFYLIFLSLSLCLKDSPFRWVIYQGGRRRYRISDDILFCLMCFLPVHTIYPTWSINSAWLWDWCLRIESRERSIHHWGFYHPQTEPVFANVCERNKDLLC